MSAKPARSRPDPTSPLKRRTLTPSVEPLRISHQMTDSETPAVTEDQSPGLPDSQSPEHRDSVTPAVTDAGGKQTEKKTTASRRRTQRTGGQPTDFSTPAVTEDQSPEVPDSQSPEPRTFVTPEVTDSGTAAVTESGSTEPRYITLVRKEARLRADQADALVTLRRRLARARAVRTEPLTDNSLIRVAVDLLLQHADQLHGNTEDELRDSVTQGLPD